MESREEIVQKKMRALIDISCQFEKQPKQEFCAFHKEYLKFSFNAVAVEIDYNSQQILSSNSKPLTTNPVRLFEINNALVDKLSYTDLAETLAGCLQDGHLHQHFYENLLLEYSNVLPTDPDFLTA